MTMDEVVRWRFITHPEKPGCGGISKNGATPPCCETHILAWDHDPSDLGILHD